MYNKLTRSLLLLSAGVGVLSAQPAADSAKFEVASIKPSTPGENRVSIQAAPGGRFTTKNVTVKQLMQQAFGIRDFQITGGPGWMASERFDVSAKADGNPSQEEFRAMMRNLLKDRFQLAFHTESKEGSVYALVVAKGGPKIQESKSPGNGPNLRRQRTQVSAVGAPMPMVAAVLSDYVGRQVIDKTGLTGQYDFTLEWTADNPPPPGSPEAPGTTAGAASSTTSESSGPSIFTALQEQLGLKLESQKGTVDSYIIDKIEKPTEN